MATDNNNLKTVAQIYSILQDKPADKSVAIKKVLRNEFDINYTVPKSKCKLAKVAERTVLDFALDTRDLEIFQMLIKHGADFTALDGNGSTILHRIAMESFAKKGNSYEMKGKQRHPFADSVLSAHVEQKRTVNPKNPEGISHFHIACMFNHARAVQFFLEQYACVDQAIDDASDFLPGYAPMHVAAKYSAFEAASLLLKYNAALKPQNANGSYPLFLLVERNREILDWKRIQKRALCAQLKEELASNEKMIRLLLQESVTGDIGLSVRQVACTLRDTHVLEQTLERPDSMDFPVSEYASMWPGYTALHFAAIFNVSALRLLLIDGGDILAKDAKGVSTLDLCVQRYSPKVLHSILTIVPRITRITFMSSEMKLIDLILAMSEVAGLSSFLMNYMDNAYARLPFGSPVWPGFTTLHLAVLFSDRIKNYEDIYKDTDYPKPSTPLEPHEEKEYYQRVQLCLAMGSSVNQINDSELTPLHLAFRLPNWHIVDLLLMECEKLSDVTDYDEISHLHIACTTSHIELIENMLKTETNVNKPILSPIKYRFSDKELTPNMLHIVPGSTCLHIATATGNAELVGVLMEYGADPFAQDAHDMTPIHHILLSGSQIFNYGILSEKFCDDRITAFGLSHLQVACFMGHIEAVEELLDNGANIESRIDFKEVNLNPAFEALKPYDGYTPLRFAWKGGHIYIVRVLIEHGADIFSKSNDGSIPFYESLAGPFEMENLGGLDRLNNSDDQNQLKDVSSKDDMTDVIDTCPSLFALNLMGIRKIEEKSRDAAGVTSLHIACLGIRTKQVIKLLREAADPNARIHSDSPIWPGATPLHALLALRFADEKRESFREVYRQIQIIGRALLKHGACVTVGDNQGDTPIHKAFKLMWSYSDVLKLGLHALNWIVIGHTDFSVNPANKTGISHFDIACMSGAKEVVENFLKRGVRINARMGYFNRYYGGFTALHLASLYKDDSMVDFLLKREADCHAVDFLDNTPLHTAAMRCRLGAVTDRPYNETIYAILLKAGADANVSNLWAETPLAVLLRMNMITPNTLQYFSQSKPCCVNLFNFENEEGLLGRVLCYQSTYYRRVENVYLYQTVVTNSQLNKADEKGRTVIHNVVSIKTSPNKDLQIGSAKMYTDIIHGFIKSAFDIDAQDNRGETALHKAVRFSNYNAVVGLLNNGADIDVIDANNKPAFSYCIENKEQNVDVRRNILEACLLHVYKLQIAGIEVNSANENIAARIREEPIFYSNHMQRCSQELDNLKSHVISNSYSVTLYDLLSKSTIYYRTFRILSDTIEKMMVTNIRLIRITYPEFTGLLQMQYRYVILRLQLLEPSRAALNLLSRYVLPLVSTESITQLLRTVELKQLIKATQ
ncbi:ankyrin-3-like [Phymastichus coffea]|uniref:ankyrin-3-like n=1 Tax=Phymastichus coffea TaxID=108790 RepID=UPI00273ACBDF|nr:ankyrin-3-like [Phymastichus coffea]